jgi:UDP-glucose 4-epimerase
MAIGSLVTGGPGFIGSQIVDELVTMGHDVVALDDLSGGFRENLDREAEFIRGTCLDASLVERVFRGHRFRYVYHLAAYAVEALSHFIRRFNYTNYVFGSMTIVDACVNHGVECLVSTSSIAVYGPGQVPMVESMAPEPAEPYGIAQYAVELERAAARWLFGLNSIIFRPLLMAGGAFERGMGPTETDL